MSLLGRVARPITTVVAALTLVFLALFGGGCGRSDFGYDLDDLVDAPFDPFDGFVDAPIDGDLPDVPGRVVSLEVTPLIERLTVGQRLQFRARGLLADGTSVDLTNAVGWSSNLPSVVTIRGDGLAEARAAGSARIRASFGELFAEADAIVTDGNFVDLVIDPSFADLPVGGTQRFTLNAVFADGTAIDVTASAAWRVEETTVATVSGGLVTAIAPGATTLRADFRERTAFAKIAVQERALTAVEISPFAPRIGVGVSVRLRATAVYADGTRADVTSSATWEIGDAAIARLSFDAIGTSATGITPGTTSLRAVFGGRTGTSPLTVTGGTITGIEISPSAATIAPGSKVSLTATANYSDGTSVDVTASAAWKSSDPSVAGAAAGSVSGVAAGTATITAEFGGAIGSATITVSPARLLSLAITPNPASVPLGSRVSFVARGTYAGGSVRDVTADVSWTTADPSVATISNAAGSKGLATPVAVGKTLVRAQLDGVEANATLEVTAAVVTAIRITPDPLSLVVGTRAFARATATYSDGTSIDVSTTCTWASDATATATVSNGAGSQGQVTAVAVGSTTIRCTQGGITGRARVEVTGAVLEQVTVSPVNPTCRIGDVIQLQATAIGSNGTTQNVTQQATWSASPAGILQPLVLRGRYRCAAAGSATVSASFGGRVGTTTVRVSGAAVTSIQVEPASARLAVGTVQQYQATAFFSDGTSQNVTAQATWSSTAPGIAQVTTTGVRGRVTALAAGSTTIRAVFDGVTGSTPLTVVDASPVSITITPQVNAVPVGVRITYVATANYSDGSTRDVTTLATWSSTDPSVIAVGNAAGSKGQAQAIAFGTASIRAAWSGVTGSTSVSVTSAKLVQVQITPFRPTLPVGIVTAMSATGVWDDGYTADLTAQATWTTSDASIASVSNATGSKGRVTPVAAGTATIRAAFGGITGSNPITVSAATLASIVISPDPAAVAVGGTVPLVARGTFSDGTVADVTEIVGWTSTDVSIADVSNAAGEKGVASGFRPGTVGIQATRGAVAAKSTLVVR
jgi:hypothetical protein